MESGFTSPVDISFDDNIHAANPIQFDFFILVISPITHGDKILAARVELLVAFSNDRILVERCRQFQSFLAFLPGIVIDYPKRTLVSCTSTVRGLSFQLTSSFNVDAIPVAVEPNV